MSCPHCGFGSGRTNKSHHHSHEQTVDGSTFKGVAGRSDEMSVWGLRGRIHTEAAYFEDLSGDPPVFLDFQQDGQIITQAGGGIEIPTLPNEVVIATHCSVIHEEAAATGDLFQLLLLDFAGAAVASSPIFFFSPGPPGVDCFTWDAPHAFSSCDGWGVFGITGGTAAIVRMRILNQFVAIEA